MDMEGSPPGVHTLHGGCASMHGVQRPISPQVLIKPRKSAGLQREGGRAAELGLPSIKSTHPPLPIYDTLVTGMSEP